MTATATELWFSARTSTKLHRKGAGDHATCNKRIIPNVGPRDDGTVGITYLTAAQAAESVRKTCPACATA